MWETASAEAIAAAVGVHRSTVQRIATRLRLPQKHLVAARMESVMRERWDQQSTPEIAAALGVSVSTVRKRARRMGLPKRPNVGRPISHGTRRRYQKGCHCPLCVEAQSAYSREFRLRAVRRGLTTEQAKPKAWRCPCDAYRINQGPTCGTCGQQPPWIEAGDQQEAGR